MKSWREVQQNVLKFPSGKQIRPRGYIHSSRHIQRGNPKPVGDAITGDCGMDMNLLKY